MPAVRADPPAGHASPGIPASAATAPSALSPADPCQGLLCVWWWWGGGGGGGGGSIRSPLDDA